MDNKTQLSIFFATIAFLAIATPIFAAKNDNRELSITTLFKTEYWQWDEFLYSSRNDTFVTERGPIYSFQVLSNIHFRKRLQSNLKIGLMCGAPNYKSENYYEYYDTTFTITSETQYAGFESNLNVGFDFPRNFGSKIQACLTPVVGLEYKYWKRTIPWKSVYTNETLYVQYHGYYEHWHNLMGIAGMKASMVLFEKLVLGLEVLGGYPAIVLERTDVSDASYKDYTYDLEPELQGLAEGKASIGFNGLSISITGKHMRYNDSKHVWVEMPNEGYRYQPRSMLTVIGLAIQYRTYIWNPKN